MRWLYLLALNWVMKTAFRDQLTPELSHSQVFTYLVWHAQNELGYDNNQDLFKYLDMVWDCTKRCS